MKPEGIAALAQPQSRLAPELAEAICAKVEEQALVSDCCDVINIPSPTGSEQQMAEHMRRLFTSLALEVTWQEIEDGRANVIGRWTGASTGPNLMFNGHMDTSNNGDEAFLTGIGYKPHAVVRNGVIFGLGIYNMKGALVCYVHAVKALQAAGVRLKGDVILGAVAGEIEKTQWGEFQGKEYRGYGAGSHYLVNHGVLPDMCILGEPTDMNLVLEHYGSLWVRLSTRGNYVHTAFAAGHEDENAIGRMHQVLNDLLEWIPQWNREACCGDRRGTVNLGCIRAGQPWRASRTPERADLFLDVRVPPAMHMNEARRRVKQVFVELQRRYPEFKLEFETYVSVPGAQISPDEAMVRAIAANHKRVTGKPVVRDTVLWCSDASVLSRYGIPTVNYGPSSGPRDAEGEKVKIQTLVDVTKIYALTAAEVCGVA
ncbi:MAG TPA: M20/M25/M40 family metallo-hydrolase [Terriglobales bacterium]|nr:M20/M25/M40 family metallo-hydrolase [Terriglobales bacterium]